MDKKVKFAMILTVIVVAVISIIIIIGIIVKNSKSNSNANNSESSKELSDDEKSNIGKNIEKYMNDFAEDCTDKTEITEEDYNSFVKNLNELEVGAKPKLTIEKVEGDDDSKVGDKKIQDEINKNKKYVLDPGDVLEISIKYDYGQTGTMCMISSNSDNADEEEEKDTSDYVGDAIEELLDKVVENKIITPEDYKEFVDNIIELDIGDADFTIIVNKYKGSGTSTISSEEVFKKLDAGESFEFENGDEIDMTIVYDMTSIGRSSFIEE